MAAKRSLRLLPLAVAGVLWLCRSSLSLRGAAAPLSFAFPRARDAEKMRLAKYETADGNPVNALLKPQKDEDEDSQEETTEEKVKAGAILSSYALAFVIPLAFLAAVILGIWTPGTDVEIGASKSSPYRSMGAISRFDDEMDKQRRDYENRPEKEY
mmetsp:Transcript_118720/g.281752  ORF Transcript_118720/g.281752 Transcript_118720/m.281752 type:complete len:156 (+) Transcript_118720:65-532(+)